MTQEPKKGERLTRAATRADYDPPSPFGLRRTWSRIPQSSTILVAALVNRSRDNRARGTEARDEDVASTVAAASPPQRARGTGNVLSHETL
jgi:hypothetical protein